MRHARRRRLWNAPSSKSDLVESLLRLGDIARNNQVGEVTVALDKAKQLIDKYGLSYLIPTYQKLVDKVAAFQRGEKVERDDQSQSRSRSRQSSGWEDPADFWRRQGYQETGSGFGGGFRQRAKEQRRRAKEERYKQWYEQQRQRDAERARAKAEARGKTSSRAKKEKAPYKRPRRSAGIEWLWTKAWSPKRGKAGERWKAYYGAATVEEMLAKGGKWSDVKWNVQHHLMRIKESS